MENEIMFSLEDIEGKFVNKIKKKLRWKNVGVIEGELLGLNIQQVDTNFEIDATVDEEELDELVEIKYHNLVRKMCEGILKIARQRELTEPYMDYDIGIVLRGLFSVNFDIVVTIRKKDDEEGVYEIGVYVEYVTYLMNPEYII